MKRKFLLIMILLAASTFCLFAKEGEPVVTRTSGTILTADLGLGIRLPMDKEDVSKKVTGRLSFSITPFKVGKIGVGVRAVGTVAASKSAIKDGEGIIGKLKKCELSAAALLSGSITLAKSFEVFGGIGPEYIIYDFNSKNDFVQGLGWSVEFGGRGRVTDHLGVGVQLDFFKATTSGITKQYADLSAFASIEL